MPECSKASSKNDIEMSGCRFSRRLPFAEKPLAAALLLFVLLLCHAGVRADEQMVSGAGSNGEPGVSSPGSPGMAENEAAFLAEVRKAEKKGKSSQAYIGSLLALGMHYNRVGRFADAVRVMRQALAIVDGGALKPTPAAKRVPERTVVKEHNNGVVSAEVVRQPLPYEEILEELLPQLVSAEISAGDLRSAELHVKRLISFAGSNEVRGKLNLISAYSSYAEICRKQHRQKEADMYQRKADEINRSFKPL
jgi:hypothetical protein